MSGVYFYIKEFNKLNFNFFVTHKFYFFVARHKARHKATYFTFFLPQKKKLEKLKLLHVVQFYFSYRILFTNFFFLVLDFIFYTPNNIQYDMLSPHCDVSYVTIVTKRYILFFE